MILFNYDVFFFRNTFARIIVCNIIAGKKPHFLPFRFGSVLNIHFSLFFFFFEEKGVGIFRKILMN